MTEPGSKTWENPRAHSQERELTSPATSEHAAAALDWAGAKHAGLEPSGAGLLWAGRSFVGGAWSRASALALAAVSLESAR